jgi:23S rRNA maturation-related 3'-5' exoribonuclease YhaM
MIRDIQSDSKVSDVFLVKEIQFLKTKDKRPYTAITFMDRSGEIKSFIWDTHLTHIRAGTFVKASGFAKEHNGDLVIRLKDSGITPVPRPENLDDYIVALDHMTVKTLWEELMGFVNGIQDKFYKAIVQYFVRNHEELGREFSLKTCPLTDELYGNYAGALLEHIVYCLRHAKAIHQNYFDRNCPLDLDLLVAILIMHDAGRMRAFRQIYNIKHTDSFLLLGYRGLTSDILGEVISKVEMEAAEWDEVKRIKLVNGIYTAADLDAKPNSLEGMLAQRIQNMDALVGAISRTLNFAKAGQPSVYCKVTDSEIYNG